MQERIRASLENARILGSAAWGASTRRSILRSGLIKEYLGRMNREPVPSFNPEEKVVRREFFSRITQAISERNHSVRTLLTLPWSSQRIEASRLAASLIAFSDDHGKKTVPEFFPIDEMFQFLHEVKAQSLKTGKQLTVVDQFDVALRQTDNNPVAAALLAHSSYRAMRSCDTRLSSRLSFEVESDTQPINMMSIARSTADFAVGDTRDPLGNTYHWWSQFSAGMIFALLSRRAPIQVSVYNMAFYLGPNLTLGIRNRLLHMPLSAGDHKNVDRQGMRLGRAMGNVIVNKLRK